MDGRLKQYFVKMACSGCVAAVAADTSSTKGMPLSASEAGETFERPHSAGIVEHCADEMSHTQPTTTAGVAVAAGPRAETVAAAVAAVAVAAAVVAAAAAAAAANVEHSENSDSRQQQQPSQRLSHSRHRMAAAAAAAGLV